MVCGAVLCFIPEQRVVRWMPVGPDATILCAPVTHAHAPPRPPPLPQLSLKDPEGVIIDAVEEVRYWRASQIAGADLARASMTVEDLTEDEVAQLLAAFAAADPDNTGVITGVDLPVALGQLVRACRVMRVRQYGCVAGLRGVWLTLCASITVAHFATFHWHPPPLLAWHHRASHLRRRTWTRCWQT